MGKSTDPFSLVYDALWSTLEAHAGFTAMVKAGNRIKFSGANRDPMKQEIAAADLPEVRIVSTGGTPFLNRTSSSASVTKRYEIQVATGDQRLTDASGLFAVEWEIIRALHGWEAIVGVLMWAGKEFVQNVRPLEIQDGVNSADLNRGIKGWSTVWACEVEMWFSTADLQPTS